MQPTEFGADGITPLQYLNIQLDPSNGSGVTDFSKGNFYQNISGFGFYVDAVDQPVTARLTNLVTGIDQDIPLRTGLVVRAPFRGLSLAYATPFYSTATGFSRRSSVRLIVFQRNCAEMFDTGGPSMPAQSPGMPWVADPANGATAQNFTLPVPPGARRIVNLQFGRFTAATIDQAYCNFNVSGATITSGSFRDYRNSPTGLLYSNPNLFSLYGTIIQSGTAAGNYHINYPCPINIPSFCDQLLIGVAGTGLAAPVSHIVAFE